MTDAELKSKLDEVGRELETSAGRWIVRRRRRKRVLAGSAAVALLATVLTVGALDRGPRSIENAAAEVLDRAAAAVKAEPLPRGAYDYEKTIAVARLPGSAEGYPPGTTAVRQTTEVWAARDGSGRVIVEEQYEQAPPPDATPTDGKAPPPALAAPPSPRRREARLAAGRATHVGTRFRDEVLRTQGLSARRLTRLSRNQREFDRVVRSSVKSVVRPLGPRPRGAPADEAVMSFTAEMLGRWGEPMPAQLQQAFYRLASHLRGIERVGGQKDALGRKAVGVSLGDVTLLFDRHNYALLETRYSLGEGGETRITRVRHAVVDSDRARR